MDFLSAFGQTVYQGQRLPRVKGYSGAEKFHIPINTEAALLDEDNPDVIYLKKNNSNNNEKTAWYDLIEKPIPEMDPEKFVTIEQFNRRMEKIEHGIDTLTKSFTEQYGRRSEYDDE